ncbi:hypothetical protein BJ170DRAFT_736631 [Xylariales sp. AK1849]|nr:hypothetical protein BJ170DRAFT_736631 [Xylariales sp. AK1849]
MKRTIFLTTAMATSAYAWTMQFDCPRGSGFTGSYSGTKNKGCTVIPTCTKGDEMVWGNPASSNCHLRLYAAGPCSADQEIGSAGPSWTHTFTRQVGAWGVTNC